MLRGSTPGEENLTFLLCEYLTCDRPPYLGLPAVTSEGRAGEIRLRYRRGFWLRDARARTVFRVEVLRGRPRYSSSPLTIPILTLAKSVPRQAKRLFQSGRSREFSIYSSYESFDEKQAALLKELARAVRRLQFRVLSLVQPAVFRLLRADAKIVRRLRGAWAPRLHWHRIRIPSWTS